MAALAGTLAGILVLMAGAALMRPDSLRADDSSQAGNRDDRTAAADTDKNAADRQAARERTFAREVKPFLAKFCFDCHSGEEPEAGLGLDKFGDVDAVLGAREKWEKLLGFLESGAMPPADHYLLPAAEERKRVAAHIDEILHSVDCNLLRDPGRVTIRRLNRTEYNNTIRDLVGVDFQPAKDFPSDDVGEGFDNIGDVLSLPPLLMEKYLDAAEQIAERAIVIPDPEGKVQRLGDGRLQVSGGGRAGRSGFYRLSSTGEVFAEFEFSKSGEYVLRAEAAAEQAGPETAKMEFRLDDKKIKVFEVEGHRRPDVYETKLRVEKGRRRFAAAFINDYYKPDAKDRRQRDRNLAVRYLEVQGPIGLEPDELPAAHRRIVFVRPGDKIDIKEAAEQILKRFATRAFRRPVRDDEIAPLVQLVELAVERGDPFEQGIRVAVQAVLVSPHFLFRVERDPDPDDPQQVHRIRDYELATRLSYFLWSTMPDKELFRLAGEGVLHRPEVLEEQVRRMLADPKSGQLVKNFGGQWLNLRLLAEVSPDPQRFPGTGRLKPEMRRETEMLFAAIIREDRSVLDFLDAEFTFLNERLAKHYGIDGVKGEKFRRVSLEGTRRRGVLMHASILTLTSDPTRTSPVKRGKWILENILDQPPPPAPPGVPELEEARRAAKDATLREQMELHRRDPRCASCHATMDALGFAFENFDAVGRWREKEAGKPIDASGGLPGGEEFNGPAELVQILKKRDEKFARCLTRKMLTYALGRGLEYYDKCAVDEIVEALKRDGYRFSTLVTGIVKSNPFLRRRGENRQKSQPGAD